MKNVNEVDLRGRTLIGSVKVLGGKELHFRNEKTAEIEVYFVAL